VPITDCQTLVGTWPTSPADISASALAAALQSRGVSGAVAAHTTAIFYDQSAGNRLMQEVARTTPTLLPAAVINPRRYPACLEEVGRALSAGVVCYRFYPGLHHYPFAAECAALAEVLAALRGAKLLQIDFRDALWPILPAALGALLPAPTVITVSSDDLGPALAEAKSAPGLMLDTSRLTATGAIEAAVRTVGAERVLFGSGAPLSSLGSAVMSVQYAELSDSERAAVMEGNAARLLA